MLLLSNADLNERAEMSDKDENFVHISVSASKQLYFDNQTRLHMRHTDGP